MKGFVIVAVIALAITCWVNDSGSPPYQWPVISLEPQETTITAKQPDGLIPEMNVVDKPRHPCYVIQVEDDTTNRFGDFPWWVSH
jgi:hypothetical protein